MPSSLPRVQVTVDAELAAAMAEVDPSPASRSRLIRDLAVRGAEAERERRDRVRWANQQLIKISTGEIDMDLDAVAAIHAEREAGYELD